MSRKVIIQARNGASRFPNKMVFPIDESGRTVLEFVLDRILKVFKKEDIIVATTFSQNDDEICSIANHKDIEFFRGDEKNVLKRFLDCANTYGVEEIIRICADNPFINLEDLSRLKDISLDNADYISFNISGRPSIQTHYGFWGELVSKEALDRVKKATQESIYLEHVTNFIYTNNDLFKVKLLTPSIDIKNLNPKIRLTLDTKEDLDTIKILIKEINKEAKDILISDILYTLSKNEYLYNYMNTQIKNNTK